MKDRLALLEIMTSDQDEFSALAKDAGLKLTAEGESSGLDGTSLLTFSISVVPPIISLVEFLLRNWLEKRKSIQIKVDGTIIEADSLDELERVVAAIKGEGN